MRKSSYVLRALKILGLEEMLKMSEVLEVKQVPLKQAAGGEHFVWDEAQPKRPAPHPQKEQEADVLPFPKKSFRPEAYVPEAPEESESSEGEHFFSSDLVLWQRELNRQSNESEQKKAAASGYRKSTEMYVVKTSSLEGKDKIRFAATDGVLINKKQA